MCPIVRLHGHVLVLFLVSLRTVHTVLHNGCSSLHSHQQQGGFPFLHILSSILSVDFLMVAFLTRMKWYVIIVLICISLIISHVEDLFLCLLAISMSSLKNCLLRSYVHFIFLIGLFFLFLLFNCMSYLYILDFNPLSVAWFANIFSYSDSCLFFLFIVFFAVQKF